MPPPPGGGRARPPPLPPRHSYAPVTWAKQSQNRISHGGTQPLDQIRATFGDDDRQPGVFLRRAEQLDRDGLCRAVLEANPRPEPFQRRRFRRTLHLGQVGSAHAEFVVGYAMRERSTVGEDQRPSPISIEP